MATIWELILLTSLIVILFVKKMWILSQNINQVEHKRQKGFFIYLLFI
jgi:hypothetical protein